MKKIKVVSLANIAFIKYWGQRDKELILPYNDSFSMNLSSCLTTLSLKIYDDKRIRHLYIKDYKKNNFATVDNSTLSRVEKFYEITKKFLKSKNDFGFKIYSQNSFPKKAGIASSASFFSALALGFSAAFGKKLSCKKLSILARLSGSGSACRSVPNGFSWWRKGTDSNSSYAQSIAEASFWSLVDLVLILSYNMKMVGSQEGHKGAKTSRFFKNRLVDLKTRSSNIKTAFLKKDFSWFGKLVEEETLSMHFVMMTQSPPLYFWSGRTIEIIKKTIELRKKGPEAYFTIDAGENVHIVCQKKDMIKIYDYFIRQKEVEEIIINQPTIGTRIKT